MLFEAKCFCGKVNRRKVIATMRCELCFGAITFAKWKKIDEYGRYSPVFYRDLNKKY